MKIAKPWATRWPAALTAVAVLLLPMQTAASATARTSATAGTSPGSVANYSGLTAAQKATLPGIARDTWKFYAADVDPGTHLPLDNLTFAAGSAVSVSNGPTSYGRYTSAANIWAARGKLTPTRSRASGLPSGKATTPTRVPA